MENQRKKSDLDHNTLIYEYFDAYKVLFDANALNDRWNNSDLQLLR